MEFAQVRSVLDAFDAEGVRYWVAGGSTSGRSTGSTPGRMAAATRPWMLIGTTCRATGPRTDHKE